MWLLLVLFFLVQRILNVSERCILTFEQEAYTWSKNWKPKEDGSRRGGGINQKYEWKSRWDWAGVEMWVLISVPLQGGKERCLYIRWQGCCGLWENAEKGKRKHKTSNNELENWTWESISLKSWIPYYLPLIHYIDSAL